MPGSSLWLLPPPTHPLFPILTKLISSTLPAKFPSEAASSPKVTPHFFSPHMTLTSDISPSVYGSDPQAWLDSLPFPSVDKVRVRFGKVKSQDFFYRRCYISVGYEDVEEITGVARARGVYGEHDQQGEKTKEWLEWWRKESGPHVSLMYGDVPITEEKMREIGQVVASAGVTLPEDEQITKEERKGHDGWEGGVVWLVPSDGPIEDWKPIAVREL
ncbi:putative cyclic phosphodiesterase [Triangularia verruculosa]|uniref:2',3'-cyclic-nucleotide 3'-phosphodiesterase n=1 Tax=Triangularia verruculosa TaxID=2587418 RepID=A0AAN6XEZ5_9PEZI|nr:putative cyclic phosphodiesterase [Triangularia verruculosa]